MKISEMIQKRFNRPENKGDEFGFTNQYSQNSKRIINKDGTFNVIRVGEKKSLFHNLVTMRWSLFALVILSFYILLNVLFAFLYLAIDFYGIGMTVDYQVTNRFLVAFFFSAQTLTTVGYGSLYPLTASVSAFAAFEALLGLMSFAIFTGLMYGRFSRPTKIIRFSKNMLYVPYKQGHALMFRIANQRDHDLTELEARVLMSVVVSENGKENRKYQTLEVENDRVVYFPLNWTIVHYIDEKSPLYGLTQADYASSQMEWLIMIKGYNITATQHIHEKSSYALKELIWDAKFKIPYAIREDGITVFELDKIDEYDRVSSNSFVEK
ncbi:MAG: ion channel [Saprospiraceae bacterium]|nr:ion channel [Saprospiraceae bacterium]